MFPPLSLLALVFYALAFFQPAMAVEPDEILADPILEKRAREISKNLRCVVCQNEAIDSSNAELARQLRLIVRERLVAGDEDAEVKTFLVARYGDFVLFEPPMRPDTWLLWYGPITVLGLGGLGLFLYFRGSAQNPPKSNAADRDLSQKEEAELTNLLRQETTASYKNKGKAP